MKRILLDPEKVLEVKRRTGLSGVKLAQAMTIATDDYFDPSIFTSSKIEHYNRNGGIDAYRVAAFCKACGCDISDITPDAPAIESLVMAPQEPAEVNVDTAGLTIGFGAPLKWRRVTDALPSVMISNAFGTFSGYVYVLKNGRVGVCKLTDNPRYGKNWRFDLTEGSKRHANACAVAYMPVEAGDLWAEVRV